MPVSRWYSAWTRSPVRSSSRAAFLSQNVAWVALGRDESMDGAGLTIGCLPGVFRAGSMSWRWYPPGVLGLGLSSTTTRSGACAKRLEMPGVLGLPPGVFARPNRAGVLAAPGVFAREGVLAFCHETGIDAANVLRDDGVLASAAFDASSIVGSVMPNGGRLRGAYRCGRDAGASGAVEAAFVAKFIVEHNGRDEKKTHKKVQVTANDLPVLAHLLDASATEERARERRRPAHRRSEH